MTKCKYSCPCYTWELRKDSTPLDRILLAIATVMPNGVIWYKLKHDQPGVWINWRFLGWNRQACSVTEYLDSIELLASHPYLARHLVDKFINHYKEHMIENCPLID
jgi:hypothetical protein